MKRLMMLTTLLVVAILTVNAQTGIHFEQQLKWSEIVAKAKAEHKYIFVDCYATWCGPCKLMEANIYPQKDVADLYNKDFISVKIQMDQTPKDDSLTKSRYDRAKTFEQNYYVDAYPTFLFFDPNGNPVHKVSGAYDVKGFIQLAADAQNLDKQYYAILKNFQPGKLDTTDEKGLPWAFVNSDEKLAAKIATDYLSRIPRSRLKLRNSGGLMERFQGDPQVIAIAANYLKSLSKIEWRDEDNINIVRALIRQPQIKAIAIAHFRLLSDKEIGLDGNMQLMTSLSDDLEVKKVAESYIARLPEKGNFNKTFILFLRDFTSSAADRGYIIFYRNIAAMDTVMKNNDFAQLYTRQWIYHTEYAIGKQSNHIPNYEELAKIIKDKYRVAFILTKDAPSEWYGYLVNDKKESQYWPQFTKGELAKLKPLLTDDMAFKTHGLSINNITYADVYLHDDDTATLRLTANWMKKVNDVMPGQADYLDTYACVLYKAGKTNEAIAVEKHALELYSEHIAQGAQHYVDYINKKITAMQNGDKIWTEKEFQ